jgi:hypothetical protein
MPRESAALKARRLLAEGRVIFTTRTPFGTRLRSVSCRRLPQVRRGEAGCDVAPGSITG